MGAIRDLGGGHDPQSERRETGNVVRYRTAWSWSRAPEFATASVAEGDVARVHVEHEHAVHLQGREDALDFGPALLELFLFLGLPLCHDFFGEFGGFIEIAPPKSRTKGRLTTVMLITRSSSS